MSPPRILIRPAAVRDMDEQADHLAQRSEPLGDRFLQAASATIENIAGMPGLGSPYPVTTPGLHDLRTWPVRGFRKHLIFYAPTSDGIEVVRVLHGARDPRRILEEET